jgi:hypothetical protein
MRTAVALATPSPRHLLSFKFLKPQTGWGACALFFHMNAMPAKHKQVPAADMSMPAPHFLGEARCLQSISRCLQQTWRCLRLNFFNTRAMPAKQKQVPAADMAMPAPQFFQYTRDAGPQWSQCFYLRVWKKWVFIKLRFGLSEITTTTVY